MNKILITALLLMASISLNHAQVKEKQEELVKPDKQEQLGIMIKSDAKPDVYVDGKKFEFNVELIDKNIIESVNVVKGEQAIKEYNAPNGVILITTKFKADNNDTKIRIRGTGIKDGDSSPLIIVDGKVAEKDYLQKVSPEDIESINVLKGEKAMEEYKSPNGVVIIKTKKGDKKKG
ncbi:TonB-dependent receptor plug domain-containing protein [Aegicerativicinus sediminis]